MKRIICILCFICIFLSSCTREYKINHLEHNIITYNDLPSTIKENVFDNHEKFFIGFNKKGKSYKFDLKIYKIN